MEIDLGRVFDLLPAMVWTARPDRYLEFGNRRWCPTPSASKKFSRPGRAPTSDVLCSHRPEFAHSGLFVAAYVPAARCGGARSRISIPWYSREGAPAQGTSVALAPVASNPMSAEGTS